MFNIEQNLGYLITIIVFIASISYAVIRNNRTDNRDPNQQTLNYLSKIKIDRDIVIEICNRKRKDDFNLFIEEILISSDNKRFSFAKQIMDIYDSKWKEVCKYPSRISNQNQIISCFCDHYTNLITQLIKKQANYEMIRGVLKSFSDICDLLLEPLKNNMDSYKKENIYIINQYFFFINEAIDNKNEDIFNSCLDMWFESLTASIKHKYEDIDIYSNYLMQFESLTQSASKKKIDSNYLSVILRRTGKELLEREYYISFESILSTLESVIDLNLDLQIKHNSTSSEETLEIKENLMHAERSLLYFMSNTQFNLPTELYVKLENILYKNISNYFYRSTLPFAFGRTSKLLNDDKEANNTLLEIQISFLKSVLNKRGGK